MRRYHGRVGTLHGGDLAMGSTLCDIGGDARIYGIPVGEHWTEPWKPGWIDADLRLE
jgi:hypothetical protein